MTCLAVWAAIRPKSSGVTSRDLNLVLVGRQDLGVELGLLGLAQLARLGVDRRLLLLGDLGEQLLLQLGRQDQLVDAEVGGVAVEVDARVLGRAGALLVGGQQRVLERRHQRLGVDALLLLEAVQGLDDLATQAHPPPNSGIRLERRMSSSGMRTASPSDSSETLSSSASVSVPVKLRCPAIGSLRADLDPPAEEAPVVLGLGQRPIRAGRGDLERPGLEQVAKLAGDALAQRQVDAVRVVDVEAQRLGRPAARARSARARGSNAVDRSSIVVSEAVKARSFVPRNGGHLSPSHDPKLPKKKVGPGPPLNRVRVREKVA